MVFGRELRQAVRQHAAHVVLGQPGEHRLAGRGRVRRVGLAERAGVDAHRMTRLALGDLHHRVALQHREVHGLAGVLVDLLDERRGARRQVDLQAGVAQEQDARPERVGAPHRHLGDVAAVHQRREQVVAGRDVQAGAVGEFGQRGLAAGLRDGFEQPDRPVDRLDAVARGRIARRRPGWSCRPRLFPRGFAGGDRRRGIQVKRVMKWRTLISFYETRAAAVRPCRSSRAL